jgi:hypothetical protein
MIVKEACYRAQLKHSICHSCGARFQWVLHAFSEGVLSSNSPYPHIKFPLVAMDPLTRWSTTLEARIHMPRGSCYLASLEKLLKALSVVCSQPLPHPWQ